MKPCLVIAESRDSNNLEKLSGAVTWIDQNYNLLSLSSIYELKSAEVEQVVSRKIRLMQSSRLSVAISFECSAGPNELVDALTLQQAKINSMGKQGSIHLYLLFYDNQVSMLPNLYLPHPEWVERKDWILASMDVWPNFEHPVLEDSLNHVGRGKKIRPGDYFFAQGKLLLNYNMPAT